ncbi:MAG: galactokinase [Ilumatobacteraceae bacterium]|jgi:D-glycero-alpha-D-manno-heptose-7-phosphate kinase|nr:galactokinase [Ilumatobacteraceae bacterium]
MIVSRTPFRVSFFGGGTDYPAWYKENGGAVLSASINKYCYITCRHLPPFFDYRYRIRYFKREEVNTIDEIEHPTVRESLRLMQLDKGLDIVHHADLPARTGMGSSSTFTVCLLHALYALKHEMPTKRELALMAIHIEQNLLKENVGSQDQTIAAFGGFNRIDFGGPQEFAVTTLIVDPAKLASLQAHLMLFFTGFQRTASEIARKQIECIPASTSNLRQMMEIVEDAQRILTSQNRSIAEFGLLLGEQWRIKRSLTAQISNPEIDAIYDNGMKAGAIGGKLLGAGGGGFVLFLVEPDHQESVRRALSNLLYVPCRFDHLGSQIIYHVKDDDY